MIGKARNRQQASHQSRPPQQFSGLTAIDIKHIEHSDECVDAVSASFLGANFAKSRSLLCVVTLYMRQKNVILFYLEGNVLEIIEALLPGSIAFNPYLDTPKYHFFASSEVNTKLHDVSVIYRPWPRLNAGLT